MFKIRIAVLGAAAALALGAGSALAMQGASNTERDSHGDAVSAAAESCAHGPNGVHGECVSDIASAEGQENRDGAQAARVEACKAKDATEDKSEKKPTTKAAKAADRIEDRAEHKAFVACVTGKTA